MSIVRFKKNVTQAEYDALAVKSPTTLYLISDTKIICLGSERYASPIEISGDEGNLLTLNDDGLYAKFGEVTGVKGVAEGTYRSGNVELAPEDLGAEKSANKTDTIDDQSSASQYPSAKVVYDEIDMVKQVKVDKNRTDRLMTVDEAAKLAGIAAGAQVNTAFASVELTAIGTTNLFVMSPYLVAQAIATAVSLATIAKKAMSFKSVFSAVQESYFLIDGRNNATIVCAAKKSSDISSGDVVTVLPTQLIPMKDVYFTIAMYNTQGQVPTIGMACINAKGEVKIETSGPATIAFLVSYNIMM
ncbi:MAG: hypothetical protein LBT59_03225 [Clostridiales bacterium]|jgi:hypothetical protein|nr:hypothetical protein [Clostridiales bacterium]